MDIEGMSFEEFRDAQIAVKVAVPRFDKPLWLVSNETGVETLLGRGIQRGHIWTATEMADLYSLDGLQSKDRRALAILKAHFGIEILSADPWEDLSDKTEQSVTRCPACHGKHFWRSVHGVVVCGNCHPPASPNLVDEWINDD